MLLFLIYLSQGSTDPEWMLTNIQEFFIDIRLVSPMSPPSMAP
jgi:hypothetical protein